MMEIAQVCGAALLLLAGDHRRFRFSVLERQELPKGIQLRALAAPITIADLPAIGGLALEKLLPLGSELRGEAAATWRFVAKNASRSS